jgi:hypothetical protein
MAVRQPVRIAVIIYPGNTNYKSAWDETDKIIELAIKVLRGKERIPQESKVEDTRFLKLHLFDHSAKVLFDIFHDQLNVETAHLVGQELPVIVVSMGNRRTRVFEANELQKAIANWEIRKSFNQTGTGSKPPFKSDFRNHGSCSFFESKYRDLKIFRAQQQDMMTARDWRVRSTLDTESFRQQKVRFVITPTNQLRY